MDPIASLCAALFRQGVYVTPGAMQEAVDVAGVALIREQEEPPRSRLVVVPWVAGESLAR